MRRGEAAATDAILACLNDTTATRGVVTGETIRHPYTNDDQVLRLPLWLLLYLC